MANLERLEELSKTISNPYESRLQCRWLAATEYSRHLRELEDVEMPEVIALFGQHVQERFLGVVMDIGEDAELRMHILRLAIAAPLRSLCRLDRKIEEVAQATRLSFNVGWPDMAGSVRESFAFESLLETMISVAEDPAERDLMRSHAVIGFNHAFHLAAKYAGEKVEREAFNARFLNIAMQSSNPDLRRHALGIGYK